MMSIDPLDPDELALPKERVVEILKLIVSRWENNGTSRLYVLALKGFRLAIKATPDNIFKTFWKQTLMFVNELLYENGKAQGRSRGEVWVSILDSAKSKIAKGDFDLPPDASEVK